MTVTRKNRRATRVGLVRGNEVIFPNLLVNNGGGLFGATTVNINHRITGNETRRNVNARKSNTDQIPRKKFEVKFELRQGLVNKGKFLSIFGQRQPRGSNIRTRTHLRRIMSNLKSARPPELNVNLRANNSISPVTRRVLLTRRGIP